MNRTKKIAYSGLIVALVVVILFLGNLVSSEWTAIFVSSFLLWITYEIGKVNTCFATTIVANIVSYLLIPRLNYVITFTFVSLYTPLRAFVQHYNALVRWIAKFFYFNIAFALWFFINLYLFGFNVVLDSLPRLLNIFGDNHALIYILVISGLQVAFFVYEFFFSKYEYLLRKRFGEFFEKI
uniref:Uncharacterized protein n=1 Tax=Fervidobacterium pennivorans TaxID=93466 RepID=A0A7C4VWQ8_FERPE